MQIQTNKWHHEFENMDSLIHSNGNIAKYTPGVYLYQQSTIQEPTEGVY